LDELKSGSLYIVLTNHAKFEYEPRAKEAPKP
jgi:hypothetical protein